VLWILVFAVVSWHHRDPGLSHYDLGGAFGAHLGDGTGRRTDEGHSTAIALIGEGCIFRQEAETGVQGLAARLLGDFDYFLGVEVAFQGGIAAHPVRLVGHRYELAMLVDIAVDGHSIDPEPASDTLYLLAVRIILQAISPRLAISTFLKSLLIFIDLKKLMIMLNVE
jgi:hypothetical protein